MSLPVGALMSFAAATPPTGWLRCDGTVLSQTDSRYISLFQAIGTAFNAGNEGAGNFRLPDMRGRFVRGTGGDGSAGMSSLSLGGKLTDANQTHQHGLTNNIGANLAGGQCVRSGCTWGVCFNCVGMQLNDLGGTECVPYNVAMQWCIKFSVN